MVADELAAEVAVEVELGAEARGALDAIDDEVQVAAELARMVAQGAETQVHGIGAGSLELLGERDALVYRGGFAKGLGQVAIQIHERGVVGEVVALFGQVDEHLHNEVVPAGGLDLLDALHHESGTVLDAAGAVLVVAVVVEAGEELLTLVEAGGIDLHGLEAHGLQLGGQGGTGGLDALDGLHGQFRGATPKGAHWKPTWAPWDFSSSVRSVKKATASSGTGPPSAGMAKASPSTQIIPAPPWAKFT